MTTETTIIENPHTLVLRDFLLSLLDGQPIPAGEKLGQIIDAFEIVNDADEMRNFGIKALRVLFNLVKSDMAAGKVLRRYITGEDRYD